jgi:hypothetical protein
MRSIYIRQDNWPQVFQKAKAEAFLRGYQELYEWLLKYTRLDCDGPRILPREPEWAFANWIATKPDFKPPFADFSLVIKQARSMGIKCTGASKDYLGSMHLKDYFPA